MYYGYYLMDPADSIVYVGVTEDPQREEEDHQNQYSGDVRVYIVKQTSSKDKAKVWEQQELKRLDPKYNAK